MGREFNICQTGSICELIGLLRWLLVIQPPNCIGWAHIMIQGLAFILVVDSWYKYNYSYKG